MDMDVENIKLLRLALRREGNAWNAYIAQSDTMEDALLIGTLTLHSFMDDNVKESFMKTMEEYMASFLRSILPEDVSDKVTFGGPEQAPEHERAGHS